LIKLISKNTGRLKTIPIPKDKVKFAMNPATNPSNKILNLSEILFSLKSVKIAK
jgi:hypothetical protein